MKLAVCSFYAFKRHLRLTDILIKRKWLSKNNSFTHHLISFVLKFNRLTSPTDTDSSNCENYGQNDEEIVYNKPFTNGQGCLAPLFKELQFSLEIKADTWYIQLFRKRLSEKVHATIPKGIVGGFEFTALQRSFKEWHERPWTYVCEC